MIVRNDSVVQERSVRLSQIYSQQQHTHDSGSTCQTQIALKMFEIPDDEEDFWENIPLGEEFQRNLTPQKMAPKRASLEGIGGDDSKRLRGEIPLTSEKASTSANSGFFHGADPLVSSAGQNKKATPTVSTAPSSRLNEQVGQSRLSANLPIATTTSIASARQNKDACPGIFNITQSSEDSDFDLSLPLQCSVASRSETPPGSVRSDRESSLSGHGKCFNRSIRGKDNSAFSQIESDVQRVTAMSSMYQHNRSIDTRQTVYNQTNSLNNNRVDHTINHTNLASGHRNINGPSVDNECLVDQPSPSTSSNTSPVTRAGARINAHRQRSRSGENVDTPKSSRSKRKFPGPAGLLPRLSPNQSLDASPVVIQVEPARPKKEEDIVIPVSQSAVDVFSEAPWQSLQSDLGEDYDIILHQFSISNMLHKAGKKQLPSGKVPLLFAVVDSMDIQGADGCVVLRDKTGRMQGTLHRQLLKESDTPLQQGVVLVLKQVGVISPTPRNHYLNITPSNVVSVYSLALDGSAKVTYAEEHISLSSTISSADTQLREVQAEGTPAIGRLLSQPGTPVVGRLLSQPMTPISSVPMSSALFQNTHNSKTVLKRESTPTGFPRQGGVYVGNSYRNPSVGVPQYRQTPSTPSFHPINPPTTNPNLRTPSRTAIAPSSDPHWLAGVQQPYQEQFNNQCTPQQAKSKWRFKSSNSPMAGSGAAVNPLVSTSCSSPNTARLYAQNLPSTSMPNSSPTLQTGRRTILPRNNSSDSQRRNFISDVSLSKTSQNISSRMDNTQFSSSDNRRLGKVVNSDPNNNGHSMSQIPRPQNGTNRNIIGQNFKLNHEPLPANCENSYVNSRNDVYQSSPKYSFKKPSQHASVSAQSASMNRNQNDIDSFWQDDVTDEMLTEMTAGDFPGL